MKPLGYFLAVLGIVSLASGFVPQIQNALFISELGLDNIYISAIGIGLVVIGVLLIQKDPSTKQPVEVPIYHGKEIVGYRRLTK